MRVVALLIALLLFASLTGCGGGVPDEEKGGQERPPVSGNPTPLPAASATPTPSGPPPGETGVSVDQSVAGVIDFSQTAGGYDIQVQISMASLSMGRIESEGGNYTIEPLFIGVRSNSE